MLINDALAILVMPMKTLAPSGELMVTPAPHSHWLQPKRMFLVGNLCISWHRSPGLMGPVIPQSVNLWQQQCCATARTREENGTEIALGDPDHDCHGSFVSVARPAHVVVNSHVYLYEVLPLLFPSTLVLCQNRGYKALLQLKEKGQIGRAHV